MPKFSDWIEHDGKGMPVDGDTFILAWFRDGRYETEIDFEGEFYDKAKYWTNDQWDHNAGVDDIVRYRIVTP